jgi:hypothetical protein
MLHEGTLGTFAYTRPHFRAASHTRRSRHAGYRILRSDKRSVREMLMLFAMVQSHQARTATGNYSTHPSSST